MEFCSNCGKEIDNDTSFCPNCGTKESKTNGESKQPSTSSEKTFGYFILGFFIPVIGLILGIKWKETFPERSKSAGKGAIIGLIIVIIANILLNIMN